MRTPTLRSRWGILPFFCAYLYLDPLPPFLFSSQSKSFPGTRSHPVRRPRPSRAPEYLPRMPLLKPQQARRFSNMPPKRKAEVETEGLNGTTDLPPADEHHKKVNAWSGPGPAAFDFRSMYSRQHHNLHLAEDEAHSIQAM